MATKQNGQPVVLPGPRYNAFNGHQFVRRAQPDPGAPAYAYQNLGLVEMSFIGPATANRQMINAFQPQPLFAGHAVTIQGLGGLVAGQMIMQPLIDPNNPYE